MLKATYESPYRKNGKKIHVYSVTGTPAEMAAFELAMGTFHQVDEVTGKVLWRRMDYINGVKQLINKTEVLKITQNNRVVIDDTQEQLALNQDIKSNLAQIYAQQIVSSESQQSLGGIKAPTTPAAEVKTPEQLLAEAAVQGAEVGEGIEE